MADKDVMEAVATATAAVAAICLRGPFYHISRMVLPHWTGLLGESPQQLPHTGLLTAATTHTDSVCNGESASQHQSTDTVTILQTTQSINKTNMNNSTVNNMSNSTGTTQHMDTSTNIKLSMPF